MSEELKKDVWDSLFYLQQTGERLKTIDIMLDIYCKTSIEIRGTRFRGGAVEYTVAEVKSILKKLKSEGLVQNYLEIDDVWEIPKGVYYPKNNTRSAK